MNSQYHNEGNYTQEVNKITQGIKDLVSNINETPKMKRQQSPYGNETNFSPRTTGYSSSDYYNGYHSNNGQSYSSQANASYTQPDLNYPSGLYSPMKKIQTSGPGTMDPRTLQPQEGDESLKRISDLSISSSTSYSSQSSTDEINGILRQTHIAIYKFNVRHDDEVGLEVGDSVSLCKVHDDCWFEGTNLRTGQYGVFPSRYVSDILQSSKKRDSLSSPISSVSSEASQFYLRFLGSVEVQDFKGNEVLCTAMKEIVKQHQIASLSSPPYCTLDISIHGIKITEHQGHSSRSFNGKRPGKSKSKMYDKEQQEQSETLHFFDLKNVTFCGCHPNNSRYFAFITKHPEDSRFACHVFMSEFSTEPVAFAIGKSFKEFYHEYLDFQGPA